MMEDKPFALWRRAIPLLAMALIGSINEHALWERMAVCALAVVTGVLLGMAIMYAASETDDG